VVAIVASAALAGCPGSGSSGGPAPQSAGPRLGTPIRLTDCSDWRRSSPSERSAIIGGVRAVAGGATGSPAGRGAVLDDDKAYDLFDGYCREPFAKRFKLYKLYTRAAAFAGR
jgi:hypothetical protein